MHCMYWLSLSVVFTVYVSGSQSPNSSLGTPQNLRETSISDTSITIQWEPVDCGDCNGNILGYNVTYHRDSEMQRPVTVVVTDYVFTAMGLLFDTQYIFEVHAFSREYGYGPPASITLNTSSLQGIVFVLHGQSYHEHSVISLDVNGDRTMHCYTNKANCCDNTTPNRRGNWTLPNTSTVRKDALGDDFYRSRGSRVVKLSWRKNIMIPMGMFCCEIPPPGPYQKACIGVYPKGKGTPIVENIVHDPDTNTLNCISSGGPATDVYWSRNSKQINIAGTQSTYTLNQRISVTENATYENVLHIPVHSIENYNATYKCLVSNSRGNDSSQTTLEAIKIEHGNLSLGYNANLTCTTIISVDDIKWSDSNGEMVASKFYTDELSLTFNPVNTSIHNKQFTCTANKNGSVSKTVTLSVGVPQGVLKVEISSSPQIIGDRVMINCMTTVMHGVMHSLVLSLVHPNGTIFNLSSSTGDFVLNSSDISDAGEYVCRGVIIFPELDDLSAVAQSKANLSLRLPSPEVNISYDHPLNVGLNTTLNCTVNYYYSSTDNNVQVNITWLSFQTVLSNDQRKVEISEKSGSETTFISQLTLSPLSAQNENISCTASIYFSTPNPFIQISDTRSSSVHLNIKLPQIYVEISADRRHPSTGQDYTLACNVTGAENLNPIITYQWMKDNDSEGKVGGNTSKLFFSMLSLSNASNYTCSVSISSSYLAALLISNSSPFEVTLEAPAPNSVEISSSIIFVGSQFNITCSVNLPPTVDIPVNVRVSWKRSNDTLLIHSGPAMMKTLTQYTSTAVFVSDTKSDIEEYKCTAIINPTPPHITSGRNVTGMETFRIVGIPSRPTNLTAVPQPTSVKMSWSVTNEDVVLEYELQYTYSIRQCENVPYIQNISIFSDNNSYILHHLSENSDYNISLVAINPSGRSEAATIMVTTLDSAPAGTPQQLRTSFNLTNITIQWDPVECWQRNGIIDGYRLVYYPTVRSYENKSILIHGTTNRSFTIVGLQPRVNYTLRLSAVNSNYTSFGPDAEKTVVTSKPNTVGFLFHGNIYGNNSIVTLTDIGVNDSALLCITNRSNCCKGSHLMGLKREWYYPDGSDVRRESSHDNFYRNRYSSVVRLNRRNNVTFPSGIFRCEISDAFGANQTLYIGVYLNHSGEGAVIAKSLVFDKDSQALICISTGGPPTTVSWTKDTIAIHIDGNTYRQTQTITNSTNATFLTTIFIKTALDQNKIVGNYSCIVNNSRVSSQDDNQHASFQIQGLRITGHQHVLTYYGSPVSLNCTTDLAVDIIEWIDMKGMTLNMGNDSMLELLDMPKESGVVTYTCKTTSMLFGSQNITVNVQILPKPKPSIPGSASVAIPIIVPLTLVLIVTLLLVVIVIIRRKNHGKLLLFSERIKSKPHSHLAVHPTPLHGGKDDMNEVTEQNVVEKLEMTTFEKINATKYRGNTVSLNDFCNYVKRMHEDRDEPFETEYATFSTGPQKSRAVANIEDNRLRNRFINIFPYDHCRVMLKELAEVDNSDYINASYMDGYQKPNAYIAAQGPLPNTVEDFWRMIWENRLSTIVMLTQCFEGKKKCECYWPEDINGTFEPGQGINVVLISMTPFTEYIVRKMTVTKDSEPHSPTLEVVQFHFVAWPDHGVPGNCAAMLNFVRRVRKVHPYSDPNTLLVHCSAGVGRTGTFIVLDSMMEKLKTEDTLNIYDFVKKLREQRVLMVQSLAQYIFIHDALKEFILCGHTEISIADIRTIINQLSMQHDECSASTGYEHQFQVLGQLSNMTENDCYLIATSEHNKEKNRYNKKLPNNFYRVVLKSTPTPGSDYINASIINGYRQRNAYIATQGPLESTVSDFWRMVWEKQSICVVLLSKLKEKDEEMCYCYWPTTEEETISYGQITVTLLSEENYGDYNLRQFEINEKRASHPGMIGVRTAFTVTQFQFMVWPEHETPSITSSLIELIDDVNKVQMGSGNRPLIVMCNDGVGRTGTFICIHAQLERLKTEGTIDFFQFIKSARLQRAGLVSDSEQYALCHDVIADYLDSFDTYANFKEVM